MKGSNSYSKTGAGSMAKICRGSEEEEVRNEGQRNESY
jgi:hypothetical protein